MSKRAENFAEERCKDAAAGVEVDLKSKNCVSVPIAGQGSHEPVVDGELFRLIFMKNQNLWELLGEIFVYMDEHADKHVK